jgi:hypothetical protein
MTAFKTLEDGECNHLAVNFDVNNGLDGKGPGIKWIVIMKHCTFARELQLKTSTKWNCGKERRRAANIRSRYQFGINLLDVRNLRSTANLETGNE